VHGPYFDSIADFTRNEREMTPLKITTEVRAVFETSLVAVLIVIVKGVRQQSTTQQSTTDT